MRETIYYVKVGRRYRPVSYYDSEVLDAIPIGAHLLVKEKGMASRRYNIDPAFAPMIAAGKYASRAMCDAIRTASEAKPMQTPAQQKPLTEEQVAAWEGMKKAFGSDLYAIQFPSTASAVEAGVEAMQHEAEKLLTNPGVRKAYEYFLLTVQLAYDRKEV